MSNILSKAAACLAGHFHSSRGGGVSLKRAVQAAAAYHTISVSVVPMPSFPGAFIDMDNVYGPSIIRTPYDKLKDIWYSERDLARNSLIGLRWSFYGLSTDPYERGLEMWKSFQDLLVSWEGLCRMMDDLDLWVAKGHAGSTPYPKFNRRLLASVYTVSPGRKSVLQEIKDSGCSVHEQQEANTKKDKDSWKEPWHVSR